MKTLLILRPRLSRRRACPQWAKDALAAIVLAAMALAGLILIFGVSRP